jgi:hypothetical protein
MIKTNSGNLVDFETFRAFMAEQVKRYPELDRLDLAIEAQAHFDLEPCLEPDCSIHPDLLDIAAEFSE